MTLVNKKPVHTEFFKGNNIVLFGFWSFELFPAFCFTDFFRLFKLFNGEVFLHGFASNP